MKQLSFKTLFFALALTAGVGMSSCKDKAKTDTTNIDTSQTQSTSPGAPEIATDPALEKGVQDATKDYPGVTATVVNGEVILGGSIERDKWVKLKQSIDGLNPKKTNTDNLTIK
jgi:hypothetical protein